MRISIWLFIIPLVFGLSVSGQQVTNIKAQLSDEKIVVKYNITGAKFNQEFNVSLFVSRDNGNTFTGPLKAVSGDAGEGIRSGSRFITWDVLREMPFTTEELVFDVRAQTIEKEIKKSFFVQYAGNLTTPAGARIGLLGKTGFFLEGRVSPSFSGKASYTYTGDLIDDYGKPGYYQFNGTSAKPAMSVLAGLTFQTGWNTFLYAGVGYSTQKLLAGLDEFDYANPVKTATSWAGSSTGSYSGAELEAGMILRFGKVIISGGATALNFEVFNFTAGIGFSF